MYTDNQERIDAYIRGKMTHEERCRFEADLKTDANLHNEYIETKAISEALADRKKKLDMMARWNQEEELRLKILKRRKTIRRWSIGASAAACIAVGFFAVRPLFMPSMNTPASERQTSSFDYGDVTYYRGSDSSMAQLDSLISKKEYTRALAFADSLIIEYDHELILFEAMDTISEKQEIEVEMYKETMEDLEWHRANILVALGRIEEAKDALHIITERDGYYSEPADSLLRMFSDK